MLRFCPGLTQTVLAVLVVLAGGTGEEERAFLALQRPDIFDVGREYVRERICPDDLAIVVAHSLAAQPHPSSRQVEVEFFSGPNLVSYQYMVA